MDTQRSEKGSENGSCTDLPTHLEEVEVLVTFVIFFVSRVLVSVLVTLAVLCVVRGTESQQ